MICSGRDYLRGAVDILESRPKCGFVAAEVREFTDDCPPVSTVIDGPMAHDVFESRADFLRGIFKGVEPMFGSVVYRRAALGGSKADHARMGQ
jgi:hypothetical protein